MSPGTRQIAVGAGGGGGLPPPRGCRPPAARYAKALLPHGGGETLPDSEYMRPDIDVDPAHLAAYNQVCGFRLTGELPATYPHMLVFPLQMALMTEKEFPFPLLGMVHVTN